MSKPLVGVPGKKYGLQVRPSSISVKKPLSIFGVDDDEGSAAAQLAREQARKAKLQEKQRQAALAEDASVFDYDAVYDGIQESKTRQLEAKVASAPKAQAKYIPELLQKAEFRARENDIIYNKNLLRDREKEDHLFADKEKFVTPAYKEKLQQDKLWQEEQARKEATESDVTKSSMTAFYANLLQVRTGSVASSASASSTSSSSLSTTASSFSSSSSFSSRRGDSDDQPQVSEPAESHTKDAERRTRSDLTFEQQEVMRIQEKRRREEEERNRKQAEKLLKRHDEVSTQSARERYLARKKLKTHQGDSESAAPMNSPSTTSKVL